MVSHAACSCRKAGASDLPDRNRLIDTRTQIARLPLTLLVIGLALATLLTGCVSGPEVGPTAPDADPDAGVLTLPSGRSYTIYPHELDYTGEASYRWPDNRTYDGDLVLGKAEGMGSGTWPNGVRYRGTWHDGRKHGHGELTRPDGSRYVGDFANGVRQGDGVEQSDEGLYRGAWSRDLPNGQGEFHGTDGTAYQGLWYDGQREGRGSYVDVNGNRYEGEWQADVPDGFGVLENANGSRYEGEWRASQQSGYGKSVTETGVVYEGTWVAGKRHGFGVAIRPDGSGYEGQWAGSRREGQGRESAADGSQHDGAWEADQPLGPGTRRDQTGIEISGAWTGDSVRSGIMRLPGGAEYAGGLFQKRNTLVEPKLLSWLEAQAEDADPHAQFFLGTAYTDFESPTPDPFKATGYFRSAARGGVPEAQFRLALLLMEKTPDQALIWLERAAAANQAPANALLGEYYLTGEQVEPDIHQAIRHLEAGSSGGDMHARNNLAWILATSDDPEIRDGERALGLIHPLALTEGGWQHFDTLAAAYAATGDTALAIKAQEAAIELAAEAPNATGGRMAVQVAQMYERLDDYQSAAKPNSTEERPHE